ncbi:MAG TPA: YceI family protein [Flavobacteriia bacterium]|nr:YceI family protein [Flavobacteriia bacterium]
MKKLALLFLVFTFGITSCKKKTVTPKFSYSVDPKTTVIKWTAYKTTDKVPVSGTFKTVEIQNPKEASSAIEALNGVEFKIPVNSIDSKNKDRDAKLVADFFNKMKDSEYLTGTVKLENNGKGSVHLQMNGIGKDLPITYIISDQIVEINATMNLDNWQAKAALDALNKACFDLHKGKDGISKTWSEVSLNIKTYLKMKALK